MKLEECMLCNNLIIQTYFNGTCYCEFYKKNLDEIEKCEKNKKIQKD